MTFAVMGKCPRTGQIGAGLATFSVNAGRVTPRSRGLLPRYLPNGCIVMSHALGNPQLPWEIFDMLEDGRDLEYVKSNLARTDEFFGYRQLNILMTDGTMWVTTGRQALGPHASHEMGDGWAVSGNALSSREVISAMAASMSDTSELDLGERLLRGLEAGRDAGGQAERGTLRHYPELSSSLFVVDGATPYPVVDLRVDYHPRAVDHLRRLYDYTRPLDAYYEALQRHPDRFEAYLEEHNVTSMPHFDLSRSFDLDTAH